MTVHKIADDRSLLKHKKMLHMIVIKYMSVSNITVTNKYMYIDIVTMLSHNIHISYLLKNVISGFVHILYTEKHIT